MGGYFGESQIQELVDDQGSVPGNPNQGKIRHQYQQPPMHANKLPDSGGGRKKNSFEDDDESEMGISSSTYVKKEYYLKGGDGLDTSLRMAAGVEQTIINQQQTGSTSNTLPKSSLKGLYSVNKSINLLKEIYFLLSNT